MNWTLHRKFTVGMVALVMVVLVAVLSVRLLGKAARFHHLERDHLSEVAQATRLVDLVNDGGKSAGSVEKSDLLGHLRKGRALAQTADGELFGLEQAAFQLLGFGEILRLPREVILAVDRMEATFAGDAGSRVTPELVARIAPDLAVMRSASDHFGPLVAEATHFVRTTAITLNVLALAALLLIFNLLRVATLGPIQQVVHAAERVAQGDLGGPDLPHTADEMGHLAQAMDEMRANLSRLVAEVRDRSGEVDAAVVQVSQGSRDLTARAEQQASALHQTAAGISELTGGLQTSAERVQQAQAVASRAGSLAVEGGRAVQRAVEQMNGVLAATHKIADINGVIDGIAFQTNILALNAAVEAARAGEQGRGFAVVASEVRSLAQRSSAAAKEIAALIGNTVETVETGAREVQAAGGAIGHVVGTVEQVSTLTTELAQGLTDQKLSIAQIDEAMRSLGSSTEQNSALAEQSSAAADAVHSQSEALVAAVGRFQLA